MYFGGNRIFNQILPQSICIDVTWRCLLLMSTLHVDDTVELIRLYFFLFPLQHEDEQWEYCMCCFYYRQKWGKNILHGNLISGLTDAINDINTTNTYLMRYIKYRCTIDSRLIVNSIHSYPFFLIVRKTCNAHFFTHFSDTFHCLKTIFFFLNSIQTDFRIINSHWKKNKEVKMKNYSAKTKIRWCSF